MSKLNHRYSKGVTLIELIISIVIISIAITGIMMLFAGTMKTSADPMIRAQALAIAQSYMDEILRQPYSGDGVTTGRVNYNEVEDYNAIIAGSAIEDQFGNTINSLSAYKIEVTVRLCNASLCDNPFSSVNVKKITVSVTHPALGSSIPLVAYRTDY